MTDAQNNTDFRKSLDRLECPQQRQLAARFVESVLHLGRDERIKKVVDMVHKGDPDPEELEAARKMIKAAIVDSHCRCGSECDWKEQATYFVARAAAAAVAPENKCITRNAAWEAAVNARMACTCAAMEDEDISAEECAKQAQIARDFLNTLPAGSETA
ncbi:hypothetical protein [Thiolapillus sp.]